MRFFCLIKVGRKFNLGIDKKIIIKAGNNLSNYPKDGIIVFIAKKAETYYLIKLKTIFLIFSKCLLKL